MGKLWKHLKGGGGEACPGLSFVEAAGRTERFKFTSGDGTAKDNVCSIGRFSDRAISMLCRRLGV